MSFSFLVTTLVDFDLIVKQAVIDNVFLLMYFKVVCIVLCSHRHWRLLWTVFLFCIPCSWWSQQEKLTSHSMSWLSGSCDLFLLFFLRDLEARAQNEFFRAFFRLPRKEKLHEVVDCSLWTPFSRCHTAGRMYASDSYICFASKENGCCTVIIPLREVEFFVCFILGLYLPFSALSLRCHLTYLQSIVW